MGKIRHVMLGDESEEKEQKRKAEARREGKKLAKKHKVEGVGLHGGERTAVVEGTDIKPEFKKLIDAVEAQEKSPEQNGKTAKKAEKEKKRQPRARSKRYQELIKLIDRTKEYPLSEAVGLIKKTSNIKFDGTVEIHISLNPNLLGEKKDLRGVVSLPHGTGKKVRIAVADDKVISDIEAGKIEFDVLIAHPSMMPKLAKVARVLGPRGLMPNPKTGTVTTDIDKKITDLTNGEITYKTEPNGLFIHQAIGKVSFDEKMLTENILALTEHIGKNRCLKITLTSTMGPGIKLAL
jgi:large subunit ribosomal protein L1